MKNPTIKVTRAHFDEGLASWFLARAEAYRVALRIAKAGKAAPVAVSAIAGLMANAGRCAFREAKANAAAFA